MTPPTTDPTMMRWLAVPRLVEVDPCAVIVLPKRWPTAKERSVGVSAGGLDLRLDQPWLPATLYRWLRVRLGFWIAEIEVIYASSNGTIAVPLRQWVSQEAIRLPNEDGRAAEPSGGRRPRRLDNA